jgi:hypothetical protein
MSLEHFKIMAFLMKRQVDEVEQNLGISISLPMQLLNQLRVSPEDWAKFWQRQ